MADRKQPHFFSHFSLFGSCLAMIISYSEHHHILWAIFHGILSWIYVIYYTFVYIL